MYRVCKPNGRILISDVVLPESKVAYFNKMEKLRDNSHVSALMFEELAAAENLK